MSCNTNILPIQGLIAYGSAHFIFVNGQNNDVSLGVVLCNGSENVTGSPSLVSSCLYGTGEACSSSNSQNYYTAGFNNSLSKGLSYMASQPNIIWILSPSSNVYDGVNVYYNDYVYLSVIIPGGQQYYISDEGSKCEHSAMYLTTSDSDAQLFKITTPSGSDGEPGGTPVMIADPSTGQGAIAFEMNDNQHYLFYDESGSDDTNGWVWSFHTGGSSSYSEQTAWYPIPYSPGQCGRIDPYDTSNYLWSPSVCGMADATNTIGDSNYGVWSGQSPAGSPMSYIPDGFIPNYKESVNIPSGYETYPLGEGQPLYCANANSGGMSSEVAVLTTGPCAFVQPDLGGTSKSNMGKCGWFNKNVGGETYSGPTSPIPFQGLWESQTTDERNQLECCGGTAVLSDRCHPYYCPQSTVNFGVNSNDGGNCLNVMKKGCNPKKWGKLYSDPNGSDAWIGLACDSFIAQGNQTSASEVAKHAIKKFYEDENYSPTDNHPFVRRAIELSNKYPGIADNTFTQVCSKFNINDLDTTQWSGRKWDPDGTNLLDTCGCFLSNDNYYLDESEGINVVCNNVCGFPNAVKPLDESTGDFLKCGGSAGANVCAISNLVVDSINSTGGGVSLNQTCDFSGSGPSICYLGGVDLSGVAQIQVAQNCDVCYNFDPNDPSKPAQQIECTSTPGGGGTSSDGSDVCLGTEIGSVYMGKAFKWLLLGVVGLLFLMLMVGIFKQYSNHRKLNKKINYQNQYINAAKQVMNANPQK